MSVLSIKDVSVGYEGKAVAEHISMEVKEGNYVCILGENGAGKSTLIRTILRLQKPLAGTIDYEDSGIGYLPQQTTIQKDFPASVWEVVLSGNIGNMGKRPFYSSVEKKRAKENLEKMGIWNLRKKSYRNLSGGQQQRVLLARALCASSKLLFLDEPVSGLDPKVTLDFYKLLQELNAEGMTIIMVSHDMSAAVTYASHILQINKESVFYGALEDYLKSDAAISLQNMQKGDD